MLDSSLSFLDIRFLVVETELFKNLSACIASWVLKSYLMSSYNSARFFERVSNLTEDYGKRSEEILLCLCVGFLVELSDCSRLTALFRFLTALMASTQNIIFCSANPYLKNYWMLIRGFTPKCVTAIEKIFSMNLKSFK